MSNKSQDLTAQELKIARLIAEGLSNEEISKKLFISSNTLKGHLYNIYTKFGLSGSGVEKSTMRVRIALNFINNVDRCKYCKYKKMINIIKATDMEENDG